jgi:hypothetical protein
MGGKRRLADRLIPLFPPHECYVEVFAGGAALYFMKPQPSPVEVLNDINGDLVTLYRVVQNHLEEFVRQFKWALSSRQVDEAAMFGEEQDERFVVDEWEGPILTWLEESQIGETTTGSDVLIPHEKLREAATPNAALTAHNRPPAQLAKGYESYSLGVL